MEEVLGQAGGQNDLQWEFEATKPVFEILASFEERPYQFKDFSEERSAVRNAVKHMREKSYTEMTADLEKEAADNLMRACRKFYGLGRQETDLMSEFQEWLCRNIVGYCY